MLIWYNKRSTNVKQTKEVEKFLKKYDIPYIKKSVEKTPPKELYDTLFVDDPTEDKYKIIKATIRDRKNIYKNNKARLKELIFKKQVCQCILVDYDTQKVCYGIEDIGKFVPRDYRRKQMDKYLKILEEMDKEYEEKHHLSNGVLG